MKRNEKGITLIALIITVIVLLILAGTAVSIAINGGDIFDRANEAKTAWNSAVATEEQKINEVWNILNTMTEDTTNGLTIPTGLTTGDTVTFGTIPSGTYEWNKEYYSDDDTVTKTLYSGASATTAGATISTNWSDSTTKLDMTISSWKVLDVDTINKVVRLVPSAPTASGVKLRGAQGYNNAVKLLDDACDALYGGIAGNSDGITARSIKIEDIEELIDKAGVTTASAIKENNNYGTRVASAFTVANSKYPRIYEEEAWRGIGTDIQNGDDSGLGMSSPANLTANDNGFIARTNAQNEAYRKNNTYINSNTAS